ncbi:MAG: helix-turn-helix domain-containing protein [Oscillospiraceae bacterium]|nr:helix-turn-helix domain-containing protein [Oscillospiraceae bacterium]
MISENIKLCRIESGMSQEELAEKLGVVRQTVSKWENNLSVPDADILIRMAELLDVPVNRLLGVSDIHNEDLSLEISELRKELETENMKKSRMQDIAKVRGWIIFISFVSLITMLSIGNEIVSMVVSIVLLLLACIILYKNIDLLTESEDYSKKNAVRFTTIFDICLLALCLVFAIIVKSDMISDAEKIEEIFAMLLMATVIFVGGIISPRLPFTDHTGLRLPWTVADEDTWNLAHKVIEIISLPLTILFIASYLTIDYPAVVATATIILWIGIPGVISGIFFLKKFKRKQ